MEKLKGFSKAYLDQLGLCSNYNKLIIEKLKSYYESGVIYQLLDGMNEVNNDQISHIRMGDSFIEFPECFLIALTRIRSMNQSLLQSIDTIRSMEVVPKVITVIDKMSNNINTVIQYIDDLLRSYFVNLPDDKKDKTIRDIKGNLLDSVIKSLNDTCTKKPEDEEAYKLFIQLQRKKDIDMMVSQMDQSNSLSDKNNIMK